MNHILIEKDKYEDFTSVLPIGEIPDRNRYILGAYNDNGDVAGALSFYFIDYEYIIDWLYVVPSMRRLGAATNLLYEVFRFIRDTGEVYPLRAEYEVTKDDMALYGFFLSRTEMDTEFAHLRYYVTASEIASVQELKRTGDIDLKDYEFFSLPMELQNRFMSQIISQHGYFCEDRNNWKKICEPKLCRVVYRGDKLLSAIFVTSRTDGNLELSYLYGINPIATKFLMTSEAEQIIKNYPGSKLIFDVVGARAEPLAKKLFPDARTVFIYESVW